MEKTAEELLPIVTAAQRQVEDIRGVALHLMETVTCAGEVTDLKTAVGKLAKATAAEITQLQALGRELDGTLQSAKTNPARSKSTHQRDADEMKRITVSAAGQKRWAMAAAAFGKHIQGFGANNPLVWNSLKQPAKRQRRVVSEPADALLVEVVQRVQGVVGGGMKLQLRDGSEKVCSPGEATEVWLTCEDVITSIVSLSEPGHADPVRVVAFAPSETDVHAWGFSCYLVFRRVSAVATRALAYFSTRSRAAAASAACANTTSETPVPASGARHSGVHALEDLLLWMSTYTDLFSNKCCITGTLLAADLTSQALLPPLLRPYKLSPEELREAAKYPNKRRAYHLHVAPYTML